jgi:hypothetical protein
MQGAAADVARDFFGKYLISKGNQKLARALR